VGDGKGVAEMNGVSVASIVLLVVAVNVGVSVPEAREFGPYW
jgi:hypothetical protein